MNESINRINVLISSIRAVGILSCGTRKMVDCSAAPTELSRWRWLEPCPSTAATIFIFCIWQIWSMDRQEQVATLRGGESSIECLDWHRRVESGTARWFIAGFVHFPCSFCSSIHSNFGAAAVGMRCLFGTWKWTEQCRIHANSQDIQIGCSQWPFRPTADCSHLPMRTGKCLCGAPRWVLPPIIWIIRVSVSFEFSFQKWQPIFQFQTKNGIWWINRLRWSSAGTKLAIPNESPEVNDD